MPAPDPQQTLQDLKALLPGVTAADRQQLGRRLGGLERRASQGLPVDRGLPKLIEAFERSAERRRRRAEHGLDPRVDPELPIAERADDIARALAEHQLIVVAGETGSGKTTQLPKICLAAGRGVDGWIGVTQPRRIAARSIAARLAEELNVNVGGAVGYQVRFDSRVNADSLVKVMTDGILLAETQADRELTAYDTLIIDEAHERSLNVDFLLGYLKQLLPRCPELKVIITSATIDTERFAAHFDDAPIIEVSGRSWPVEVRYRPLVDEPGEDADLLAGIGDAVDELTRTDPMGDVLVFLPGERDIRDAQEYLAGRKPRHTEILPLYGRLSGSDQQRIFHPGPQRRIILATNVAETSLTVPRIRFVIDSGLARISRYSHRSKVQRLPIEPISQASANQRAGRCGRLGPGVCIRLYDEDDFSQRPDFTEPEIVRTNLATVILQMETLGLGRLEDFPFLDPPDSRLVRDGYQLLQELGALDDRNRLTRLGRALPAWPLDVRLARLMEAGREYECVAEAATLAAALSIQDPRERPLDAQQQADAAHEQWVDHRSDFVGYLKLWREYHETREKESVNRLRKWCKASFLHFLRMREWSDVRRQLVEIARENGAQLNREPAGYEPLHRALLAALVPQVGYKDEDGYQGPRGQKFHIFPGSGLHNRGPKWLVTAFLMETTRVFARDNAAVDVAWIERAAGHLVKSHCFEPFWSRRAGRVMGYEQVTLYGLPLVSKRRIHYGPRDPVEARKIFILEALVRDRLGIEPPFVQHNRRLVERIETLEEKQRRRDLLVDETIRYGFFDRRVPEDIHDRKAFERWRQQAEAKDKRLLFYSEADLLAVGDHDVGEVLYPDAVEIDGVGFPASYRLEPGSPLDGVTLRVPLARLGTLRPGPLEWLVPGYIREKITALIKTLPKSTRRAFVPVPEWTERFIDEHGFDRSQPLGEALARYLSQRAGVAVAAADFDHGRLPDHLRMNLQIFDGDALVDAGRDLEALQESHAEAAREEFLSQAGRRYFADDRTGWDFGELPESVALDDGAGAWPAVVDQEDAVGIRLFEERAEASEYHRHGLRRLLELNLKDKFRYLERHAGIDQEMCLHYTVVDTCEQLKRDFTFAVSMAVVHDYDQPVRDAAAFDALVEHARSALLPTAARYLPALKETLAQYFAVHRRVYARDFEQVFGWAAEDILSQLGYLVYPGFLIEVDLERLTHYPRYLEALTRRLERMEHDPGKDRQKQERVEGFWRDYLRQVEELEDYPPALDQFHWLIEEYRVSLFAQELGTRDKVSASRLKSAWAEVSSL